MHQQIYYSSKCFTHSKHVTCIILAKKHLLTFSGLNYKVITMFTFS